MHKTTIMNEIIYFYCHTVKLSPIDATCWISPGRKACTDVGFVGDGVNAPQGNDARASPKANGPYFLKWKLIEEIFNSFTNNLIRSAGVWSRISSPNTAPIENR